MGKGKGRLIVFEGIDGCGKTTQSTLLYERLCKEGYNAELLRFPDKDGMLGDCIKRVIYTCETSILPTELATICAVNRYGKANVLKWWLHLGKIVILDRYVTSNIAYQLAITNPFNMGVIRQIENLEYDLLRLPKPTRVLLLRNRVSTCRKNVSSRSSAMVTEKDLFERKDGDFFERLQESYDICSQKGENWTTVDCKERAIEEIHEEIFKLVTNETV